MRILVTGGAGFIGSNVVDGYLAAGHEVTVVDDLSAGTPLNVSRRVHVHRVDVRSPELDAVFAAERPEIVSHHAAQVSVRRSVEEPIHDAEINVLGSLNLLETARRHGVRRVIFASTGGAIYGEMDAGTAADERHPCRPRSPYAVAKLAVEHYLDGYRIAGGLETVVLRYANVYGPRQDPHGEAGVVSIFLGMLAGTGTPRIYGDGTQTRDYVYAGDVARAFMAAVGRPAGVVNVGTGREVSVLELYDACRRVAQVDREPQFAPARLGELQRSVLDPSLAERELGWRPEMTLDAGLAETWDWIATTKE